MVMNAQLIIGSNTFWVRCLYFLKKNATSHSGVLKKRYPEITLNIGTELLKKFSIKFVNKDVYGLVAKLKLVRRSLSAPSNSLKCRKTRPIIMKNRRKSILDDIFSLVIAIAFRAHRPSLHSVNLTGWSRKIDSPKEVSRRNLVRRRDLGRVDGMSWATG